MVVANSSSVISIGISLAAANSFVTVSDDGGAVVAAAVKVV